MKKTTNTRRDFIKSTGKAGLAAGLSMTVLPALAKQYAGQQTVYGWVEDVPYEQQPLGYAYPALEPVIDAMTMELHYSKHAAAYAKNLADAVKAEGVDVSKEKLVSLLGRISKFSPKMRNNGGGHYNHEFFWKSMRAASENNQPSGELAATITRDFGTFDAFKTQFSDAGKNRFGSGWAWLVLNKEGSIDVYSTANQDSPLMQGDTPILGLDVWEHAYYLNYQNRRPDYIGAFWNVVNWGEVAKNYAAAK